MITSFVEYALEVDGWAGCMGVHVSTQLSTLATVISKQILYTGRVSIRRASDGAVGDLGTKIIHRSAESRPWHTSLRIVVKYLTHRTIPYLRKK